MVVLLAMALGMVIAGAIIVRWPAPVAATPTLITHTPTGLDPDFCAGCGHVHRAGAMAFTTSGAYRCRVCCYGKEL